MSNGCSNEDDGEQQQDVGEIGEKVGSLHGGHDGNQILDAMMMIGKKIATSVSS
jgi:hypothetical protein